jgi:putative endonuclease
MRELGNSGETLAAYFLKQKGYRILERNYTTPIGEIDIIAKEGETIVFIEVKTRTDISFGYPFESVHIKKIQKLKKTALCYMKKQGRESSARFDVISIILKEHGNPEIEHIKDAFEV